MDILCMSCWLGSEWCRSSLWFPSKYSWKERIVALLFLLSFSFVYSNLTVVQILAILTRIFLVFYTLFYFLNHIQRKKPWFGLITRLTLLTDLPLGDNGMWKGDKPSVVRSWRYLAAVDSAIVGQCPKNWVLCSLAAPVWMWAWWKYWSKFCWL